MSSRQQILIVDDRPENLRVLNKVLAGTGAEVIQASSGEEALAATLERDFALAILDVQMPVLDGYGLAALLRGDPGTRHIPIIFMTAVYSQEEHVFRGYESGAVDYIVKPYNPAILISKVNVFLELHAQRDELRRQRTQLTTINAELEAFAHSVAHELQAPLRAIGGFSEALTQDYADGLDDQGKEYLQRASAAARRMGQMVDDLLELARVTRSETDHEVLDLSAMAEKITRELSRGEPDRRVEIVVAPGLLAPGCAALIDVALANLLRNAWKFTSGRPDARVELGSEETQDGLAYYVRDNGAGFDMAYCDRLFGAFQRLHDASEFPGTGIGLAVVQRVVHRHGGRVWARGEVDRGATFYFTLPQRTHHRAQT